MKSFPVKALRTGVQRRLTGPHRVTTRWALAAVATAAVIVVPSLLISTKPIHPPSTAIHDPSDSNTDGPIVVPGTTRPVVDALTSKARLPPGLDALFRRGKATVYDRTLPVNAGNFRIATISSSGLASGVNQTFDDGVQNWSATVVLDLPQRRYTLYKDVTPGVFGNRSPTADHGALLWSIGPPDRCINLSTNLRYRIEQPSFLDDGRVLWNESPGTNDLGRVPIVRMASGCGHGVTLPVRGELVSVGWPWLYLKDGNGEWLNRVNAESGEREALPRSSDLPASFADRSPPLFAAHDDVAAWVHDEQLDVADMSSRSVIGEIPALPIATSAKDTTRAVTVGDRFVAYASQAVDGARSAGLLYDTVTRTTISMPGEVFAGGPWLIWLENDDYHVFKAKAG